MYDLISIGDIKLDSFLKIPEDGVFAREDEQADELRLARGKKIPAEHVDHQIAGSAPNVAIALRRLELQSTVLSTMGHDWIYQQAKKFLRSEGVPPRFITKDASAQSSFSAVLNFKGESTQLAAHSHLQFQLPSRFPATKWVHLSELGADFDTLFETILSQKAARGFNLSFNPGAVQIHGRNQLFDRMLGEADLLFVNRYEASVLTGLRPEDDIRSLLQALHANTPTIVVITDGKDGSYVFDGKIIYFAPMFPGERVEATGAGDSFTSGFIGGLLSQQPLDQCLAWGSVNAASCVQFIGPTKGLLTRAQLVSQLENNSHYHVTPY